MNRSITTTLMQASIALPTSIGFCSDWFTSKTGNAVTEQGDSYLFVHCDTSGERALHPDSRGLILIFFHEPTAHWEKDKQVEVTTLADDGSKTIGKSYGRALSTNDLMLKNDATWELSVMGNAKNSFTITAGGYARTFSALKLQETVKPVLEKCGDHW
jgi:hypothetical protein